MEGNPLKQAKKPVEGTSTRIASQANSAKAIAANPAKRTKAGCKVPTTIYSQNALEVVFTGAAKTYG